MDWLERIKLELAELNANINRVHKFITDPIFKMSDTNRMLLEIQFNAMSTYATVLKARIANEEKLRKETK